MQYFEHFIWNFDGTFKSPKDILNDQSFYNYQKEFPTVKEFYDRVISSSPYLSRLNINQLNSKEIKFVENAIINTVNILETNKSKIYNLFKTNVINEYQYNNAIKVLNSKINDKETYLKNELKKETKPNKNPETDNSIQQLNIEEMLKPEPRKKIKLITKSKEKLKSIIDKVTRIKTGYVVLGSLYLMELMGLLTNSAELFTLSGATLGSSVIASEIYKAKNNR